MSTKNCANLIWSEQNQPYKFSTTLVYVCDLWGDLSNLPICQMPPAAKCKGDLSEWEVGGKFSDWDYVLERVNEGRTKPLTVNHWKKKNMIGILAKWVIRRPFMFGLDISQVSNEEFERWSTSEDTWYPVFESKYQGDLLKDLLKTEGELIEFDAMLLPIINSVPSSRMVTVGKNVLESSSRTTRKGPSEKRLRLRNYRVVEVRIRDLKQLRPVSMIDIDLILPDNLDT